MIAVYRGKSSMIEYIAAGAITGGTYKFNLGLRGITAGMIVGGVLGTIGGGVSLLILKSTGMTMEEVRYWQYKWRSHRDDAINDSFKFQLKGTDLEDPLMDMHDQKPGVNLDLNSLQLEDHPAVTQSKK